MTTCDITLLAGSCYVMAHPLQQCKEAQWLSGRVLDSRLRGCGFEPHQRHCAMSMSKNINPRLILVQPRKTRPYITERLLMGCKELNQTNKQTTVQSFMEINTFLRR